jgi:type I restriction enzyme, S subunit
MSRLPTGWGLPTGWKMKPFGEVATLQRGFDLPVQDRKEGQVKIFAANGPVGTHNVREVRGPGVVTGRSGSIGKVHYVDEDFWPLNTALWVKDFHGNDPKWVARILTWMDLEQYTRGVGVPTLNRNLVHEVEIPLPPLEEQKRIAAILDQADALRRLRTRALDRLNTLGQAIFQEMFGDWRQTTTPYPLVKLGDLLSHMTSGSRGWAEYYADSGASFIRIQNVGRDKFMPDGMAYVAAPDNAEANRTRVKAGDVLLSITADLGRTAVVPSSLGEAYINQHLAILRTDRLLPRYLSASIASPSGQYAIARRNREGVKAGLNFDDVRAVEIPLPPKEKQQEFAERLDQVDVIERQLTTAFSASETLFASLQHRAFRGEL